MHNFRFNRSSRPVSLIGINAPFEPPIQFGREYSAEQDKRAELLHSGSVPAREPVKQSIKEPLPQRQQTILFAQLSPHVQRDIGRHVVGTLNEGRNAEFFHPACHQVAIGISSAVHKDKLLANISPKHDRSELRQRYSR